MKIEAAEQGAMPAPSRKVAAQGKRKDKKTLRVVRVLHIYVSMFMLTIMLFFTVTGLTLNHREWLPDAAPLSMESLPLPDELASLPAWQQAPLTQADAVRRWLRDVRGITGTNVSYDWQAEEQVLLIDIKRPGGYHVVEVLLAEREVLIEAQEYGLIAVFNDLHMGRYSGLIWRGFIDISAVLMLLFTLTGFWLVLPQKKRLWRLLSLGVTGAGVTAGLYFIFVLG